MAAGGKMQTVDLWTGKGLWVILPM